MVDKSHRNKLKNNENAKKLLIDLPKVYQKGIGRCVIRPESESKKYIKLTSINTKKMEALIQRNVKNTFMIEVYSQVCSLTHFPLKHFCSGEYDMAASEKEAEEAFIKSCHYVSNLMISVII